MHTSLYTRVRLVSSPLHRPSIRTRSPAPTAAWSSLHGRTATPPWRRTATTPQSEPYVFDEYPIPPELLHSYKSYTICCCLPKYSIPHLTVPADPTPATSPAPRRRRRPTAAAPSSPAPSPTPCSPPCAAPPSASTWVSRRSSGARPRASASGPWCVPARPIQARPV